MKKQSRALLSLTHPLFAFPGLELLLLLLLLLFPAITQFEVFRQKHQPLQNQPQKPPHWKMTEQKHTHQRVYTCVCACMCVFERESEIYNWWCQTEKVVCL